MHIDVKLRDIIQSIDSVVEHENYKQHLLSRIQQCSLCPGNRDGYICHSKTECAESIYSNRYGVLGEVAFWYLLKESGLNLIPTGLKNGMPDFYNESNSIYFEVAKPILRDHNVLAELKASAEGDLLRSFSAIQQFITGTLDRKLISTQNKKCQFDIWNSQFTKNGMNNSFCLCVDLSCFSPCDLTGHVGGLGPLERLLYGYGNTVIPIYKGVNPSSLLAGEPYLEICESIKKRTGANISIGYFGRSRYPSMAGVLSIDNLENLNFYRNPFSSFDFEYLNQFESEGSKLVCGNH